MGWLIDLFFLDDHCCHHNGAHFEAGVWTITIFAGLLVLGLIIVCAPQTSSPTYYAAPRYESAADHAERSRHATHKAVATPSAHHTTKEQLAKHAAGSHTQHANKVAHQPATK